MLEEWRRSLSWPAYEVSSWGRVRNIRTGRIRILKGHVHGYMRVGMTGGIDVYVHRLVCEAFHGPAPVGQGQVDHINNIRSDNSPENVRWCSQSENLEDRLVRYGSRHPGVKLSDDCVRQIRSTPRSEMSDGQFASYFMVSREVVRDIRSGKDRKNVV